MKQKLPSVADAERDSKSTRSFASNRDGLGGLLARQWTHGGKEITASSSDGKAILHGLRNVNKATIILVMNPIAVSSNEGKKVNILGIPMLIRIHDRDTGGVFSVVESHEVPVGGSPPHGHNRADETFQIFEGDYEFVVDGKTIVGKPLRQSRQGQPVEHAAVDAVNGNDDPIGCR